MSGKQSPFAEALDQIVANYNLTSKWYAFSKDRLSVEGARVLVQQWGIFNRHSRCCWAFVVGNCPHMELRKFIVGENLYEEEAIEGRSHFDLLLKLGNKIGLAADEIWQAKPLPTTVVALHTWETLTKNRTWYEGATAKVTLERTNKPKCGQFSAVQTDNWMRHLGLSRDDVEFWTLHDSVDQVHSDGTVQLLEKYMSTDSEKQAALHAAEDSMIAWKIYLDGIAEAGGAGTRP